MKNLVKQLAKKYHVKADFEEDYEEHDEDQEDEPQEDDAFLAPSGSLGSKTSLSIDNEFIGEFSEDEDAQKAIVEWINKNQIRPNIWWVSDHGNVGPYSLDDKYQKMIKM
jgi:hypothetical protein